VTDIPPPDPNEDEWTDDRDEVPLADEPGIADDLGPDGGPTPLDVVPGSSPEEAGLSAELAPIDPKGGPPDDEGLEVDTGSPQDYGEPEDDVVRT
jgi:hypothetical protein